MVLEMPRTTLQCCSHSCQTNAHRHAQSRVCAWCGLCFLQEEMNVYIRERLNGYYQVSSFVVSNMLASAPFIALISIMSTICVYFLAGLNLEGDRFVHFFINLYVALTATESLMTAIAAIVPHYLMGIAGGAGILGMCCKRQLMRLCDMLHVAHRITC